jgi:thiamine kinase-like enzyme
MGAYEFIKSAHPFFPQIESLRTALASELQPAEDKGHSRSLLRIDFDRGRPQLKWAYVSKQSSASERFEATTYVYRRKRDRVDRYEFPNDPKLQDMGSVLNEFPEHWTVLRYVPRRRLTINIGDRVAKFVRRSELPAVVDRLRQVERTLDGKAFSIPRLTETRPENGILFEELVEGRGLDAILNRETLTTHLETAGKIACRIHQHDPANLPRMQTASIFEASRKDEALLTVFNPDLKKWLATVLNELFAAFEDFESETTFCHGDFRAPHLLSKDNGDWSVVDFDGATSADPHWEIVLFLTSLKREFPMFAAADLHEEAIDAFIAGYEREGRNVNREKLQWFRLAAEIHFLARSFQRDLYTPELFAQSVCDIARLSKVGQP